MIPRTFPSTYASNGQQQMVVYFLPSIAGLQRWLDYIPVKLSQGGVENSYANNGYIDVTVVSRPTAAQQAWKEYIPVYLDDAATDAWQVNARGYIPYGYALFGGASMIMDMTNTGALDSRVTFSRTSNATQFDSSGNLVYAPHNLLTFSEQFDNAAWVKTSATIAANTVVAPNGTTTADTITLAGAGGDQRATQGGVVPLGAACTFSVWLKGTSGQTVNIELDTTALTVTLTATWVRYSVSGPSAATTAVCRVISRSGNTATVFDVWGAQLNIGTLQPYYPTTVKNLLGFAQEFDNAAWTKSNSFVQTNLLTFSEQFDNAAWTLTGTTATANAATAPNGSVTADRLTSGGTQAQAVQAATITSGATVTGSCYFKNDGIPLIEIVLLAGNNTTPYGRATFNVSTGVISTAASTANGGTNASAAITDAGNGWYRCSVTVTYPATTSAGMRINGAAATGSVLVWGAQLVQGSVPGDYQRTDATARAVMYPAPDGSVTGDKLVEDTAAGVEHRIGSVSIAWTGNGVYSTSFYVKAAGRFRFDILFGTAGNWVNGDPARVASFNLQTGTVSLAPSSPGVASIVSVGDGWYRCRVTATATAAPSASGVFLRMADSTGSATYTGNGTDGILIWGAQLSDSASLDPYVYNPVAAPTAAAYYGPRFDYDPATLAARGLLIEEQRTQLLLWSQEFSDATWVKNNATVSGNLVAAPDGTTTADKVIESAVNGDHSVQQPVTVTSGVPYTFSCFLKAAERTQASLEIYTGGTVYKAVFNIANGTFISSTGSGSYVITPIKNGWFRIAVTGTSSSTTLNTFLYTAAGGVTTYAGDGISGIYAWGAQAE